MNRDDAWKKLFAELIREKLGLFRSISFHIVNSSADADDAVQRALLKAWERRTQFRNQPGALAGWVSRIVVSESYDTLRRRARESRMTEALSRLPDKENPDDSRSRMLDELDRAIEELPELYRETIHVAVLSGLPGTEAARLLECSPNTLYQRIHKAKSLLLQTMRRWQNE
ncbi:RNA polymerase sigma factor [uncultured Victivallis sp.]|uniref:RNA polymerase sigma factor n=1 Tax=uncultured Victivallis sp. TaxID=354118 RepID=UPI0025DE3EE5|nr:RNA polymerase sigma factor [uncultured Victivallis sp.]